MRQFFRELIGRVAAKPLRLWTSGTNIDASSVDYAWWDRFRRGVQKGFQLAGLLAKPAAEIKTAWIIGDDVSAHMAEPDEYTDDLLRRFFQRFRGVLVQMVIDLLQLGNQYIVVNADGSLSVPSPDMVEVQYDPVDYRRTVAYIITTRLEGVTVTDEYRLDGRTVRVKSSKKDALVTPFGTVPGNGQLVAEFENLIGRLPVVHFAHNRSANEQFGRPDYEALVTLYSWYDDLLKKALTGAKRLSNPILTFVGLVDPDETRRENSRVEEYADASGETHERMLMEIDEETPVLFAGEGGDIKFVGPTTGFTEDVRNMLKSLYLLFSEHLGLPDVVMGFELSAARASAAEQLRTFFANIRRHRLALEGQGADDLLGFEARGGFLAVIDIFLRYRALTDSGVKVGPAVLDWTELERVNEELRQKWALETHARGTITDETLVAQSGLVEDPAAEVEAARAEAAARQDAFESDIDDALGEAA